MKNLYDKINEAVEAIREKTEMVPEVGIILGTGLGNLAQEIDDETVIYCTDIPHFASSTVKSHKGNLIVGKLSGKTVAVMEGRFHFYEGYSLQEITFPIRILKELGVKTLIITNAAGGMNAQYEKGEIVLITDHINSTGFNPLVGIDDDRLGLRFPDMSCPYDEKLIALAEKTAAKEGIKTKRGVYLWVTGPSLETKAEYKFMHSIGADLVGMSTVPEVIVAVQAGLKIVGISCVTDLCIPDNLKPVNIEEIIKTAEMAGPKIDALIKALIKKM
ncbi:MAG: purine-nucleoside phosphorylase [Candidatus Omnitrophica bacterium]|nr:purine-nucleoside phosphorylase [Candidatus Omnitrophota bacterium]